MEEFQAVVKEYVLKNGYHANEGDWVYGWQGYLDPRHDSGHSEGCHWLATEQSEVVEYAYSAFQDTLSGNEDKVLLALTHVNCQCRKVQDVTIGVEGGAMELLHDLLGIKKEYRW